MPKDLYWRCTRCQDTDIAYSVGVIRTKYRLPFGEYPLVRCTHCAKVYFTDLPFLYWVRCGEPDQRVAFTHDRAAINPSLKLAYASTLVGIPGVPVYMISLAAESDK